jgi:hypothetical protein
MRDSASSTSRFMRDGPSSRVAPNGSRTRIAAVSSVDSFASVNTPAHALINLGLLGGRYASLPVAVGAVLPDAPIFLFWGLERAHGIPESVTWSSDYFSSPLQPLIDTLHSFPLILVLLSIARLARSRGTEGFAWSLLLHSALDFPFHVEDAHRHLFPFSSFRFASPISYWDPRHHGAVGAAIEVALVIASIAVLFRRSRRPALRAALLAAGALYVTGWLLLYRPWGGPAAFGAFL